MNRATRLLIAVALVLYLSAEATARLAMGRISKLHHRIMTERAAALKIRPASPGAPKTLLLTGNSLILEGVDFPAFAKGVSSRFEASRFVVEGTLFNDWFFSLKTLFRHGMHPDMVILGLNPPELSEDYIRGDFAARFLWDLKDIWPAARASHADLTATSSLYAAHFSTFYGARAELRGVLLGHVFPALPMMWQRSIFNVAVTPPDSKLIPLVAPRLKALEDLCHSNGSRFVFLIPPTMQNGDTAVLAAGRQTGVEVLRPSRISRLDESGTETASILRPKALRSLPGPRSGTCSPFRKHIHSDLAISPRPADRTSTHSSCDRPSKPGRRKPQGR